MPRIYQMLPQALLWILAAKRVLGLAELHLRGQQGFSKPFQLVDKYFHVGTLAPVQKSASITRIRDTFNNMERCIGHSSPMTTLGSGYFQEDPLIISTAIVLSLPSLTAAEETPTTPKQSDDTIRGSSSHPTRPHGSNARMNSVRAHRR